MILYSLANLEVEKMYLFCHAEFSSASHFESMLYENKKNPETSSE